MSMFVIGQEVPAQIKGNMRIAITHPHLPLDPPSEGQTKIL